MSPTPFQRDQSGRNHHGNHPVKSDVTDIVTPNNNNSNINAHAGMPCPSSLKIHRGSHAIKKSSSPTTTSSSSASVSSLAAPRIKALHHSHQQHRCPVIIYTHSPKVIHTNPKDFMSLVQKLTGMSMPDDEAGPVDHSTGPPSYDKTRTRRPQMSISDPKGIAQGPGNDNNNNDNTTENSSNSDDNESPSVITDENCSSSATIGDIVVQLNSCMGPSFFDPPTLAPPPSALFPNLPLYSMSNSSSSDLLCPSADPALYDYMDLNFLHNHTS